MDFDDTKHFNLLLSQLRAEKKAEFVPSGRNCSIKRIRCMSNPYLALQEILWGLSQVETSLEYSKKNTKKTLETFRYIYEECRKAGGIIQITADEESLKKLLPLIEHFAKAAGITKLLPAIPRSLEDYIPYIRQADKATGNFCTQVLKVSAQTGYAAAMTECSPFLTKESAAENVLSTWLNNHTLWDKIRTIGGAYGADCRIDAGSRTFIMSSYRDPSPEKTAEVFKECLKEITETPFNPEEVEKTVVSCYGDYIYPQSPKERGNSSFESMLYASPLFFKAAVVEKLLSVKAEDVVYP